MAGESPDRAGQQESSGVATAQQVVDPGLVELRETDDVDDTDVLDGTVVTAERSDEPKAEREPESADEAPEATPATPDAVGVPTSEPPGDADPGADAGAAADGDHVDEREPAGAEAGAGPGAGARGEAAAETRREAPEEPSGGTMTLRAPAAPGATAGGPEAPAADADAGDGGDGGVSVTEGPRKAPEKSSGATMTLRVPAAPEAPERATPAASDASDEAAPGEASSGAPGAATGDKPGAGPDRSAPAPATASADQAGSRSRDEEEASGSPDENAPKGGSSGSASAALATRDAVAGRSADGAGSRPQGAKATGAAPAPAQPAADSADMQPPRERTKQMPLPPAPAEPLKLLAALTNTPPPRQTVIRTAFRRVKIWTPLVVVLLIALGAAQLLRPLPAPALTLTAGSAFTFDGDSPSLPWPSEGQAAVEVDGLGSLGSSGEEEPVPIASVTKVMTAYLILRDHPVKEGDDGETIPVDQTAEDQYKSGLAESESVVEVKKGAKLTEYEALEHILISSANNVARLVARWDAGSETAFVGKMNKAAKELGMKNTMYTDPSGLTETTVSTAKDQVKLGKAVMDDPVFREIATKIQYTASDGRKYNNWNQLAGYNDVVGIKTGTTTKAGGNLLFAATKEVNGTEQMIIGAVLGQHTPSILDTVLARSKALILTTQKLITSDEVIKKGDVVGYVDDGLGGRTSVVATEDVTAVGWAGLKVGIQVKPGQAGIPHEEKAGTEVGTLTVGSGPGQVKVPVALESALTEPSYGARLTRIG